MGLEQRSCLPRGQAKPFQLVFLHGAWHGAWCWDQGFLQFFADSGFEAHALSLRHHGKSHQPGKLRFTRIKRYVEDLAEVMDTLENPIVIGHSMGGFIVQKYLEQNKAAGGILMAPAPYSGVLGTVARIALKAPLAWLKAHATLSLKPVVGSPALAHRFLFSPEMCPDKVSDYAGRLTDESYWAFLDMLAFDLPDTRKVDTPMLVLGAGRDNVFTPEEIRKTARVYGARLEFFDEMAHDMMLEDGWEKVAEAILNWIDDHLEARV